MIKMKKLQLLFLVFFAGIVAVSAQSTSSQQIPKDLSITQINGYIKEAKQKGYSLSQVEMLAKAKGASSEEIKLLREAWNGELKEGAESDDSIEKEDTFLSAFGTSSDDMFSDEEELTDEEFEALLPENKVFGASFFKTERTSEAPALYVATPSDYQLGPGDEITINVYGASEQSYEAVINRQGAIKIERLAPIYLSGYSLQGATSRVKTAFSQIYAGLTSDDESASKVNIDVNLKKSRSVVVNITGNVTRPGTYTLSGFTSVLNALYAAGGPTQNGSYREVILLRNGKEKAKIDLYDYFINGKYASVYLRDQDVLMVPSYKNRVQVLGAFKTIGLFELLPGETFSDVITYTGGFTSQAYKNAVYVDRITDIQRSVNKLERIDFETNVVMDGDVVTANRVAETYTNKVAIEGAVYLPGSYPIEEAATVFDLLRLANGVTSNAVLGNAILYRSVFGVENQMVSVPLTKILNKEQSIKLQPNDRLVVFDASMVENKGEVTVLGQVKTPEPLEYFSGMTVADVILLAGGFLQEADGTTIEVFRNESKTQSAQLVSSNVVNIAQDYQAISSFLLQPNDVVVVRTKEGYLPTETITLEGLVKKPGSYAISTNTYSLYDLFADADGFLADAYLEGVSIRRKLVNKDVEAQVLKRAEIQNDTTTLNTINELEEKFVTLGVNAQELMENAGKDVKNNLILKDGDVITVPKKDLTITVIGAVQKETAMPYGNNISLQDAIDGAGGYLETAKRKRAYVIYQNGSIKSRKKIFFFNNNPKLAPGATVIVPTKNNKEPIRFGDIMGATSALATLGVLLQTLIK